MPTFYFTGSNNAPSGGGKVLNEFCTLCRSRGYPAWLCFPSRLCKKADYLPNPAPVLPLDEMISRSSENDIIISGWHGKEAFNAVRESKAALKVFWQHGILIPLGPDVVGERVFTDGVYARYWNVSDMCARYIVNKYNLPGYHIVQPFFTPPSRQIALNDRHGFLAVARRGNDQLPEIRAYLGKYNQSLTVLYPPFHDEHLLHLLDRHRFFLSIDKGLTYYPPLKNRLIHLFRHLLNNNFHRNLAVSLFPSRKWVPHDRNYLGFPVGAAQAAMHKCIVVGYAMGGGFEWMTQDRMFLAEDGNVGNLCRQISRAVASDRVYLEKMRDKAFSAVSLFNSDHSWNQLLQAVPFFLQ